MIAKCKCCLLALSLIHIFIFNTLLVDKATDDRLRHYEHWLAARNLANEASDESVEALVSAVTGRYELARRWYRLKAKLLGIDRLTDYDRSAPLATDEVAVEWPAARELVLDAYGSFSPTLGALAGRFFTAVSYTHLDVYKRQG